MDILERISLLQNKQHEIAEAYQDIFCELKSSNYINENKELKEDLGTCHKELETIRRDLVKAHQENDQLKLALQEQVWSERLNILRISRQKLDAYFQDIHQKEKNNLIDLEIDIRAKLGALKEKATRHLHEEREMFCQRIDELDKDLQTHLTLQEERMNEACEEVRSEAYARMGNLGETEFPQEVMKVRARQNQIEMKIGLNWINKIGILLILLGVGAAFQYSYIHWMNSYMKGISFFLLGGAFITAGEFFFRKHKETFSTGLLGGGVAILYGSIFYSFFALIILPMELALFLSILVTASTVILSLRYQSITIGAFGLIGGFLPFLSWVAALGLNDQNITFLMGYLLILNLSVLLIALAKRWPALNWISFLLNIAALTYIDAQQLNSMLCIIYSAITFLMYLSIVLAYPLMRRIALTLSDVILLALNTVIDSILIFYLIDRAGFSYGRGVMALVFGLIYLGLGQFVQKKLPRERWSQILFYSTALTFAILVIPFQFGIHWISLGWLIEGVLLIIFGSRCRMKYIEMAGWGLFLLCSSIFGALDVLPSLFNQSRTQFFEVKYFAFTVGLIIILMNYLQQFVHKQISRWSEKGEALLVYKYFTTILLWVYGVHLVHIISSKFFADLSYGQFYQWVLIAIFSVLYGMGITKIQPLTDKVIQGLAIALYIFADLIGLVYTLFFPMGPTDWRLMDGSAYLAVGMLIIYNVFVFLSLKSLLYKYLHHQGSNFELYPLLLGVYLFANCNALLIIQFHLGQLNLLISIVYLIMAIAFIGYGFAKHFMYIRRLGLALTLFATGKLFIYDLSFLRPVGRIISYFSFGIVLLIISFIYQRVKSSLEVPSHDQSTV